MSELCSTLIGLPNMRVGLWGFSLNVSHHAFPMPKPPSFPFGPRTVPGFLPPARCSYAGQVGPCFKPSVCKQLPWKPHSRAFVFADDLQRPAETELGFFERRVSGYSQTLKHTLRCSLILCGIGGVVAVYGVHRQANMGNLYAQKDDPVLSFFSVSLRVQLGTVSHYPLPATMVRGPD